MFKNVLAMGTDCVDLYKTLVNTRNCLGFFFTACCKAISGPRPINLPSCFTSCNVSLEITLSVYNMCTTSTERTC